MSKFKLGSKIAFGAARCVVGVKENEDALIRALQKGVRVVNTSVNYMGGNSEEMVGQVLDRRRESGEDGGKDVTVISKFGYAAKEKEFPGLLPVSPSVSHSVHPDFFRQELENSMERLKGAGITAYLLEHPEANLAAKLGLTGKLGGGGADGRGEFGAKLAQPSKARMEEGRGAMYDEVTTLFEAMEERAREQEGFVYGVSSMGLAMPKDEQLHISWERLLECAEKAASRVGHKSHSFRIVEMPGNLLEVTGLCTAPAISKAGMEVMIENPLLAANTDGRYNLTDDALRSGIPFDYMDVCREVLDYFTIEAPEGRPPTEEEKEIKEGCDFFRDLVQGMNGKLPEFTSVDHYDAELATHITPLIDSYFEGIDEESSAMMVKFFDRFGKMVRYSCAQKTRNMVTSGVGCASGAHTLKDDEPLQTYAVRWLTNYPGVSCTTVDMETTTLVDDAVSSLQGSWC